MQYSQSRKINNIPAITVVSSSLLLAVPLAREQLGSSRPFGPRAVGFDVFFARKLQIHEAAMLLVVANNGKSALDQFAPHETTRRKIILGASNSVKDPTPQ